MYFFPQNIGGINDGFLFNCFSESSNIVFFGSGFHDPNYLEIKKDLISKFDALVIQNILIGSFQTS